MSLFIIPLIIFLDQVSKAKFVHLDSARLATSCNSGIAFGLFQNARILNFIVPIVVVSVCFYFLLRQERKIISLALALIVAGGVSNILDRLMMGCVRDFIDLKFWPSFNLADSAVTIGILILIFVILVKFEPKYFDDSNH